MSQPAPDFAAAPSPEAEPTVQIRASDLATFVVAKLCHDFVSPAGAVVSGLDLLKDPSAQDMREDAMALIEASAEKLVAMAHFARVAFGAATTAERFDPAQIKGLADGAFSGMRAELEWSCGVDSLTKPQARALLNLAQIAGGSLAHGGVAKVRCAVEDQALILSAVAEGPRARLKPEVVTGLSGDTLTEGLAGQWIQPYWLWVTVAEAGGSLTHSFDEGRVEITARMPHRG
ncbi:histidine phosphotransferase ChpT [Brevundimonas sp.]|uniref:histidine phosphotransferase ChpT n=1 Tax=Brevundimonas sp. TaxID=1871086 RepID=UPI0025F7773C|nr:histidine phosphotransferase family protein [Brevundimonas sp.]